MSQVAYESNIYQQRQKNITRTWLIVFSFLIFVIFVGWAFSVYYGNPLILIVAAIGALTTNITSYFFSDSIALSTNNAKPAKPENPQHLALIRSVENMSITAGMRMPRVYVIPDSAPNAFATGRNESHAAVAFTQGILDLLDTNELEGVVAHELSHIKNKDILVGTIVVVMVGFIALLGDLFLRTQMYGGGNRDNRAAGVILIVGIVFAILSPIAIRIIQAAVSRKREFLADASGALLTRYPEGLANALIKINAAAQPLAKTSSATSHLFIANPFGPSEKVGNYVRQLFASHPPMQDRVEALLGDQAAQELTTDTAGKHDSR